MSAADRDQRADTSTADTRRNSEEVAGRLAARGIDVSSDENPETLVRLLEAVESFERNVQRKGGDLMVDEPVGSKPVRQPDNAAFVLPRRGDDESIAQYTERIGQAAQRVEGEAPQA